MYIYVYIYYIAEQYCSNTVRMLFTLNISLRNLSVIGGYCNVSR